MEKNEFEVTYRGGRGMGMWVCGGMGHPRGGQKFPMNL